MESLIKADIFFFIATIALVVITVSAVFLVIYLLRLIKKTETIIDRISHDINMMASGLQNLHRGFFDRLTSAIDIFTAAKKTVEKITGKRKKK